MKQMKSLATGFVLVVLALAGCTLFSGPRSYDPMEYSYAVAVTVDSTRAIHLCNEPSKKEVFAEHIGSMNTNAIMLSEFVKNKADSKAMVPTAQYVQKMINDVLIRGNYSPMYCTLKLTNIQASARIVERVSGQTDSYGMCDGGIRSRYDLFTKAYAAKQITLPEYKELVTDVATLVTIDTAGCSQTELQQHREDVQVLEKVVPMVMSL